MSISNRDDAEHFGLNAEAFALVEAQSVLAQRDFDSELPLSLAGTPESVREYARNANLRYEIPASRWAAIRRKAFSEAQHRCSVCGYESRLGSGELVLDQIWIADEEELTWRLSALRVTCERCFYARHLGEGLLGSTKKHLGFFVLIEHLARVNGWDTMRALAHYAANIRRIDQRSRRGKWNIDYGEFLDFTGNAKSSRGN
jgi:hypothetical protein